MMDMLRVISILEAGGELGPPISAGRREFWVHPFNLDREPSQVFEKFYAKVRRFPQKFFTYYRMSINSFDELLGLIRMDITKQRTFFRNPICAELRLTVTLR